VKSFVLGFTMSEEFFSILENETDLNKIIDYGFDSSTGKIIPIFI
jgi:hypothetical protein